MRLGLRNYGTVYVAFSRSCLGRRKGWPLCSLPPKPAQGIASWCSWVTDRTLSYAGGQPQRPPIASYRLPSGFPSLGVTVENGILRTPGLAVDLVRDIIRLDPVFDERTKTASSSEILKVLRACATYVRDGSDGPGQLLGALIGEHDWLTSPTFAGAPDGHLLDGLFAFLEPIVAHSKHKGEANYAPIDLDSADFALGEPRFWREYLRRIVLQWQGRSVGVTEHGRVALLPSETKPGDTVSILLIATLPQVLSRHKDGVHWTCGLGDVLYGDLEGRDVLSEIAPCKCSQYTLESNCHFLQTVLA